MPDEVKVENKLTFFGARLGIFAIIPERRAKVRHLAGCDLESSGLNPGLTSSCSLSTWQLVVFLAKQLPDLRFTATSSVGTWHLWLKFRILGIM